MRPVCFEDRAEAGVRLAERLKGIPARNPVVLAIPRGGIEVGAPMARVLGAELDVVLSRKLRAPHQPELALGAVSESGEVYLNEVGMGVKEASRAYIDEERRRQMMEIEHRTRMFRGVRPRAPLAGRTVIVTDDGMATGSTMTAALHTVRAGNAREIIAAIPVATRERLDTITGLCDRIVCLCEPEEFWAVAQFYRRFDEVSDERVVALLRECGQPSQADGSARALGGARR